MSSRADDDDERPAFAIVDRWSEGAGWIADPAETQRRCSHLLVDGDAVWIVDPVDAPGLDEFLTSHGEPAGVVVLLDRHERDAAAIANRYDVSVHLPPTIDRRIDAPTERLVGELGETGFVAHRAVDWPGWRETVLWDGETLVVPEAVGTAPYYLAGDERLGVSPVLRMTPPRSLREFDPERVLVGHGEGVMEGGATALAAALSSARRRAPTAWLNAVRSAL